MSDLGEDSATPGGGQSTVMTMTSSTATAVTSSETVAALSTTVQSAAPPSSSSATAAAAVTASADCSHGPSTDDAAPPPDNDKHAPVVAIGDVTSQPMTSQTPPAPAKSQTTGRKRCRPTEVAAAAGAKKQTQARSKDAEYDKPPASRRHVKDYDPERLKAFNMFVRLFVDENLDRVSPISKQPKEKIQAILEACDRQFPEFHVRSRKRIRTYLKSCRRLRRCKDLPDSPQARQMALPHLTSPEAESILAQACENESNNAKRMRIGLDALSAAEMARMTTSSPTTTPLLMTHVKASPSSTDTAASQEDDDDQPLELTSHARLLPASTCTTTTTTTATTSPVPRTAGDGLIPAASQSQPHAATQQLAALAGSALRWTGHGYEMICPAAAAAAGPATGILFSATYCDPTSVLMQTAPTDLRIKKDPHSASSSSSSSAAAAASACCGGESTVAAAAIATSAVSALFQDCRKFSAAGVGESVTPRLDVAEVSAIRQLIAGYRESAAFLSRSADELQQLILHQNS